MPWKKMSLYDIRIFIKSDGEYIFHAEGTKNMEDSRKNRAKWLITLASNPMLLA